MSDIRNYSQDELESLLKRWHVASFHAKQLFLWIYKRGVFSFERMTDISFGLRERLKRYFSLNELPLVTLQESVDGTRKFLFCLDDANTMESVLIPAEGRVTACLSTQVGCKYRCKFCASGIGGFKRNLSCAEIIAEVLEMSRLADGNKASHIVFMGTGEPMDNYDNLLKAIRIINSREGLNIGARRITISTAGVIPGIERLSQEGLQVELSVSLHAACDKTRSLLMPINKIYPLDELIRACRKYALFTKRQVTFEYVLIKGVNTAEKAAQELIRLLKGWDSKVNLIVYNPIREFSYEPPGKLEALFFRDKIKKAGIPVTIRKSRGKDIQGACGQLRNKMALTLG